MHYDYICYGGYVKSQSDGQVHYVTAKRVAQLYRLPYNKCLLIDERTTIRFATGRSAGKTSMLRNAIKLSPRLDGDYDIKKRIAEQRA